MRSVLALHGMDPKAIGALRRAMADHDWAFADDDPVSVRRKAGGSPSPRGSGRSATTTPRSSSRTATRGVDRRLAQARQRGDGRILRTRFGSATGAPAMMWGPSIVGYGELHYVYESGRQGDMPRVAFSPRAAANSLYIGAERHDSQSHRESARACAGPAPGISGSFCGQRMREVLRGRVHRHGRRIVGVECALRAPEPAQRRGLGVVEARGDVQALQVARAVAHAVPLSLRLPVLSKGMTLVSHMGRLIHSPVDECMHGVPEPVIVAATRERFKWDASANCDHDGGTGRDFRWRPPRVGRRRHTPAGVPSHPTLSVRPMS